MDEPNTPSSALDMVLIRRWRCDHQKFIENKMAENEKLVSTIVVEMKQTAKQTIKQMMVTALKQKASLQEEIEDIADAHDMNSIQSQTVFQDLIFKVNQNIEELQMSLTRCSE